VGDADEQLRPSARHDLSHAEQPLPTLVTLAGPRASLSAKRR
jgi:hypothetical protein